MSIIEQQRIAAVNATITDAFARVDSMTREELRSFCIWNDPNGCYSDEECLNEFGEVLSTEDMRAIIRNWKEDV